MSKTYLKIKIKSLAEEARIIRHEEKKWYGPSETRTGLYLHRVRDVRSEARAALLAYGFLRGRPYAALEKVGNHRQAHALDLPRIVKLAQKYGPPDNVPEYKAVRDWLLDPSPPPLV